MIAMRYLYLLAILLPVLGPVCILPWTFPVLK